ncbi:unnamed protein product [Prunus armeniaca]
MKTFARGWLEAMVSSQYRSCSVSKSFLKAEDAIQSSHPTMLNRWSDRQVVLSRWRIVYAVYWWTELARNSLWLVARNWLFQNELVSIFLHVSHEEDHVVDLLGSLISHECFFTSPNLSCTLVLGPSLEWRFDLLRLKLADACDMPACWAVCSCPLPSLLVPARPTWYLSNFLLVSSSVLLSYHWIQDQGLRLSQSA